MGLIPVELLTEARSIIEDHLTPVTLTMTIPDVGEVEGKYSIRAGTASSDPLGSGWSVAADRLTIYAPIRSNGSYSPLVEGAMFVWNSRQWRIDATANPSPSAIMASVEAQMISIIIEE